MNASGQVVIEFDDEIAGRSFRLNPDLTILDEAARPAAYLRDLISTLGLETDPSGFAQADNVHRIGVRTNRAGILVAGPARNMLSQREHRLDMAAASLQGSKPTAQSELKTLARAEIDPGSCIRCLTCHRLCPHGAIQVNTRVQVLSPACEACGLCAAECPREAIQVLGMNGFNIGAHLVDPSRPAKGDDFSPKVLAFCCTRSAFPASRLADCLTPTMPRGLKIIEIPCAGSLSLDHVLTGFRNGADGTLVMTCHTDNCHAGHANQRALERVEMLQDQFTHIGLETERLHFATLASNMGRAFADIVIEFDKKLRELGPSRLK
jgi:coenzyme F420-reducing hydrogenase delta subunit/Pyruvate/2-oxoacid:ferredoxin oxidoreductase delta subunit